MNDKRDLISSDGFDYHRVRWKLSPERMHADMHKYVCKFEPMNVPTEQTPFQPKTVVVKQLAQIRWPASHVSPQLVKVVSKPAQIPEDVWACSRRTSSDVSSPIQCFGRVEPGEFW